MTQPPLEELKFQPLPELARAMRAATPRIINRWRGEVTRLLPKADALTRKQLDNSLPMLLEETAVALESSRADATERLIESSPSHGTTRFHQEFRIDQLLIEYAILRRIVLAELVDELGRALSPAESIEINQAIDVALRQAAVAFAEHQAQELRTEANAMAKYLSFLSHDLRGGLNGIMLMIEVLRGELQGDAKYKTSIEDLDTMRRSMLETVATMDRFLNAEKLRRRRMPVQFQPVHPAVLLQDVARHFVIQTKGQEQPTSIKIEADESLTVNTDRELLSMILQNLVSNAIKYGRREDVVLRAGKQGLPQELACRISVIDRGPGIDAEKLKTLFSPFTRGETYGQHGIGLGLFIARQAADLIGGRLWAESEVGSGSAFHIDLPHRTSEPARDS